MTNKLYEVRIIVPITVCMCDVPGEDEDSAEKNALHISDEYLSNFMKLIRTLRKSKEIFEVFIDHGSTRVDEIFEIEQPEDSEIE